MAIGKYSISFEAETEALAVGVKEVKRNLVKTRTNFVILTDSLSASDALYKPQIMNL